jgi:hypothetical protein
VLLQPEITGYDVDCTN